VKLDYRPVLCHCETHCQALNRFLVAGLAHTQAEIAMPRFYFDVREGTRFVPDEEGLALRSDGTACRRVMLGRSRLRSGTSTASGC
jgi:hypothetical protein